MLRIFSARWRCIVHCGSLQSKDASLALGNRSPESLLLTTTRLGRITADSPSSQLGIFSIAAAAPPTSVASRGSALSFLEGFAMINYSPTLAGLTIRPYRDGDEHGWLRCSVLSFLDTAYFDSVFRRKPRYDGPAIELVADREGTIVGVIDVECEETPGVVCTACAGRLGGMIWHLAVHPDVQRRGIGRRLLHEARERAARRGITCFAVWTRDDPAALRWYETQGFEWVKSYLHVYLQGKPEIEGAIGSSVPRLTPVQVFAHYTGEDREGIRSRFERVHDCNCFRLCF